MRDVFHSAPAGLTSRQLTLLLALAALGIALRFAAIDRSFWFDELATTGDIDAPNLATVLQITSTDNQPPLYNSSLFAWSRIFGFSEIALRSLSLLYGLLALLTPWLARKSLNRTEKLLIFTILCLMPLPIRYAQEARNYSLLFLLSSATAFCYYETFVDKSRRAQITLWLSLLLLALAHLFGLLLAVCFLAVMVWREKRNLWRAVLMLYAAALCAAVMVPLLRGGSGQRGSGNFWITFSAATLSVQLLMVITPVGILLLAYAVTAWRRASERVPLDPALLPTVMPFVLMLVGAVIVSIKTPILTDRNLIGLIPAFVLLCGWLLARTFNQRYASTTCVILCLLLVQAAVLFYSPFLFVQQEFRAIAQHSIAANSRVCYVMEYGEEALPRHLYSFYITELFHRPDLAPELMRPSELPHDLADRGCTLWADAVLSKRGHSLLRTLPQFQRCTEVSLGWPSGRLASELFDCRS